MADPHVLPTRNSIPQSPAFSSVFHKYYRSLGAPRAWGGLCPGMKTKGNWKEVTRLGDCDASGHSWECGPPPHPRATARSQDHNSQVELKFDQIIHRRRSQPTMAIPRLPKSGAMFFNTESPLLGLTGIIIFIVVGDLSFRQGSVSIPDRRECGPPPHPKTAARPQA
jgi:hypothetical protein